MGKKTDSLEQVRKHLKEIWAMGAIRQEIRRDRICEEAIKALDTLDSLRTLKEGEVAVDRERLNELLDADGRANDRKGDMAYLQRREGKVMLWENLQTYCRAFEETDLSPLGSNYTDFASFFAQHKMDYCVRIVAQSPSSYYMDHVVFELRLYVGDNVFGASQRLSTTELCRLRPLTITLMAQEHCLNMIGNLLENLD
jgi:hypothetical protein